MQTLSAVTIPLAQQPFQGLLASVFNWFISRIIVWWPFFRTIPISFNRAISRVTAFSKSQLEMIQNQPNRGSTFLPIQTGFEKVSQKAILCVLPSRELSRLNQYVQQADPKAFIIIINGVREVRGRGFTLDKHLA